jgi:murein DD-endopeptidase MepM/ murein hydrolase activator NlpD
MQSKSSSSTADIISSFKEIMALMTASSSMSSGQQMGGTGMSDLMAPIMLLLLEKLIEQQLTPESSAAASSAQPASSNATLQDSSVTSAQGSKPIPSGRPVSGRLSQNYHSGHRALDFAVPVGTPVQSTMDGRVVHAGWNNQGYGNLVIVENGSYRTYYAHLSSIPVSVGDTIKAGSIIGLSGNTGNSTGPHLHYEIRMDGVQIDPTQATLGTT